MGEYDNYEDVRERLRVLRTVDLSPERAQAIAAELKRQGALYKASLNPSLVRRAPKWLGPISAALALSAVAAALVFTVIPSGAANFSSPGPAGGTTGKWSAAAVRAGQGVGAAGASGHSPTGAGQTSGGHTISGTGTGSSPGTGLGTGSGTGSQGSVGSSSPGTSPPADHVSGQTTPGMASRPGSGNSGGKPHTGTRIGNQTRPITPPSQKAGSGGAGSTSQPGGTPAGSRAHTGGAGGVTPTPISNSPAVLKRVKFTAMMVGVAPYLPSVGLPGDSLIAVHPGLVGSLLLDYKDFVVVETTIPQPLPSGIGLSRNVQIGNTTAQLITETSITGQTNTFLYFQMGPTYISIDHSTFGTALTPSQLQAIATSLQAAR